MNLTIEDRRLLEKMLGLVTVSLNAAKLGGLLA